jgi:hypothetical protein
VAEKLGLNADGKVYHFHPVGLVGSFSSSRSNDCGCNLGKVFFCTRFIGRQTHYGPLFKGAVALSEYPFWQESIKSGRITEEEKNIFVAMSKNEGNLDSIQSYDSEILTAGAMQKTINSSGEGEFSKQVFDFKLRHPKLYDQLFFMCGWSVEGGRDNAKMYYSHPVITKGNKCSGSELKSLIRNGFSISTYGTKVESPPLAAILSAITTHEFYEQQVLDFSRRMRIQVLEMQVSGYNIQLKHLLKSALGKATALDHHVNRPGYVAKDVKAALDRFFEATPEASQDIKQWGVKHNEYEIKFLNDYGINRRMAKVGGANVAPDRYRHLKEVL